MTSIDAPRSEITSLIHLAHESTSEKRTELFKRVSRMLLENECDLATKERQLMADILKRLIHDVEMSIRRSLAWELADSDSAPNELLMLLANDEIEVARPLLANSNLLSDRELIEVIRHRTLQHQLAIATRNRISERLSGALIETGNEDVIVTLLSNSGAEISSFSLAQLVEESRQTVVFQEPLLNRPHFPAPLAAKMSQWVSNALRQRILDEFEIDKGELERALGTSADSFAEKLAGASKKQSPSEAAVERLYEEGKLTVTFVTNSLEKGEIALFEAGFAKLIGIDVSTLRRLIYDSGWEGIAVAAVAAGMKPTEGSAVLKEIALSRNRRGNLIDQEIVRLEKLIKKLSKADAARIIGELPASRAAGFDRASPP